MDLPTLASRFLISRWSPASTSSLISRWTAPSRSFRSRLVARLSSMSSASAMASASACCSVNPPSFRRLANFSVSKAIAVMSCGKPWSGPIGRIADLLLSLPPARGRPNRQGSSIRPASILVHDEGRRLPGPVIIEVTSVVLGASVLALRSASRAIAPPGRQGDNRRGPLNRLGVRADPTRDAHLPHL